MPDLFYTGQFALHHPSRLLVRCRHRYLMKDAIHQNGHIELSRSTSLSQRDRFSISNFCQLTLNPDIFSTLPRRLIAAGSEDSKFVSISKTLSANRHILCCSPLNLIRWIDSLLRILMARGSTVRSNSRGSRGNPVVFLSEEQ